MCLCDFDLLVEWYVSRGCGMEAGMCWSGVGVWACVPGGMNVESPCERERLGRMQRWRQSLLIMQCTIDPLLRRLYPSSEAGFKRCVKTKALSAQASGAYILLGWSFLLLLNFLHPASPGEETETVAEILRALRWHRSPAIVSHSGTEPWRMFFSSTPQWLLLLTWNKPGP